jgi:predicted ATPase
MGDLPRTVEALEAQAAPGTTLCSAATASLVQGDVQLKPVPAVAVAGHAQPLLAYEVLDVQPPDRASAWRRRPTRSRFVGRTRELATLHTLLAEVESGRGQVVGIVGEIGIGKSRLLAEFQHQVHGRRLTYLQGRCLAYGQATPYLPVLGLLRHACGITAADSPAMCTAKVQRALQEAGLDVDEVALPLLALLGVEAGTAALAALPPEVRKARIFTALGQFYIQKSRQGPLILEVEDLHWSDAMSAAWLEAFVERVVRSPILVLGTYRPGYRPAWLDKSYATQVALPPLAPGESHHLVQALLPTASATLAQAIVVKAEGNPFFLEELAQMVGEQEGDGLPLGVPDTVQAVLAARIDRLPSEVKHLLQVAAVIGMEVPVPLVQALTALPDEALERGLAHLQAAEFLYETHAFPAREYTFKHAFTQEVAYGSLLEASRRELHARIVEALEALYPDRLVEQVERLASHALRGELWEKAVPYCQQAGAQARARTAYGEAVHFLDQALAALAHLPESPTTLAQAIDVRLALQYPLQKLGQLQMELARVREAAAVAEALRDRGRQGWVSVYLCVVNRIVAANYAAAIDAGHRALVMATDLDDHRLEAHAAYALGQAYWTVGDLGRALNCLQRSVDLTAGYPDLASDEAQRRGWLARTLSFLGRFGDATTSAEQALRLAAARDDIGGRIQAQTTLGEVALGQGDLPRALECLEESVMLTRTWNIMDWGISAIKCLGAAYALTGRGAEAVPLVEEALERTRGVGAMGILTDALRVLGEVYLCAGRLDAAYEHAQQALERARQYTERAFEAQVLRLLGEIAVQREPPAVAQAHTSYRQALVLAEELGMRPLQAHCYRGLGTLYTKTGQQEQARTALSVAIDLYRTMTMTLWLPQVEAVLAQVK